MNELENLMGLIGFSDIFNNIPEGTDQNIQMDNLNIHITKKNGDISVEISELEEAFDDTATKEIIKEYSKYINELDDSVFVESLELASKAIDIKEFDRLLQLKSFTESESLMVIYTIKYFSQIIIDKLKEKSTQLKDSIKCFEKLCR